MEFELIGLDELKECMVKAMQVYGDIAEEELEDVAKDFKKDVIKHTRESVQRRSGNLIRGFKLDEMQGYGENISINFRGTSPHFHLIENGHEQVTKKGKKVGWVAGRLIVHQTRKEYDTIVPERMLKVLDRVTEKSGLK